MTFSKMTLNIATKNAALGLMAHNTVMLSVITLNVVMLSVMVPLK